MKLKFTSASCAHCSVSFPDGAETKLEELDSTLLMAVLEGLGPYSRPHHAVEDAAVSLAHNVMALCGTKIKYIPLI